MPKLNRAGAALGALVLIFSLLVGMAPRVASAQNFLLLGVGGAPPAGYQGPGDVVSGASDWYSCARAYNAAYATAQSPLCDIVDTATGLATCTLSVGTSGFANLTALSCASGTLSVTTFCTVTHAAGCSVTKAYDQTGNGYHVVQATLADMPVLTLSDLNSLPCMTFNGSSDLLVASSYPMLNQPFMYSAVTVRLGNYTMDTNIIGQENGTPALVYNNAPYSSSTATIEMQAEGVGAIVTVPDGDWIAVNATFDTSTSTSNMNGSTTTGLNPGSQNFNDPVALGYNQNGTYLDGSICEAGTWSGNISTTQQSNIYTNQNGSKGYNGAF